MLPVDRLSWGKPRTTGTRCRSFSFAKAVQVKLKNGGATLEANLSPWGANCVAYG